MSRAYRYLDEITYADVAFEVEARSPGDIFRNAAEALTGAMVDNPSAIQPRVLRRAELQAEPAAGERIWAHLLHDFLQELIYWKDVDRLLLRARTVQLRIGGDGRPISLVAELVGEPIDSARHRLGSDVKAVTHHQLRMAKEGTGWRALVVLDT